MADTIIITDAIVVNMPVICWFGNSEASFLLWFVQNE